MNSSERLHIIYTESDMLLSKQQYESWRKIQDKNPTYKASLGPWPIDEVVEYLTDKYSKLQPSASKQVEVFLAGGAETHVVTFFAANQSPAPTCVDSASMASTRIQITSANTEDGHAIAEVHVESWRHAYQAFLPEPYLASLSVTERAAGWRHMLERSPGRVLLARQKDQVVGFIAMGASRDKDAPAGRAEVFAIYVKPACWSAGVGRQLWLAALQQLRKKSYESVSLWVIAGNVRAINFYERAGFVAEPLSRKQFELGGTTLEEVRYVLGAIAQPASRTVA